MIAIKQMVVPWNGMIVALDEEGRMWYTNLMGKYIDDISAFSYEVDWKPLAGPIRYIPRDKE